MNAICIFQHALYLQNYSIALEVRGNNILGQPVISKPELLWSSPWRKVPFSWVLIWWRLIKHYGKLPTIQHWRALSRNQTVLIAPRTFPMYIEGWQVGKMTPSFHSKHGTRAGVPSLNIQLPAAWGSSQARNLRYSFGITEHTYAMCSLCKSIQNSFNCAKKCFLSV